ncbi:MAG: phosphoribosyltransferase family protein [Bacteroidia bacterium]|nr:phosphoribosyltransferase family protein [Bacteroidia bacterium]
MSVTKVKILDQTAIFAKLKRMAYQIYEANYLEKEIYIMGIDERGGFLAKELADFLRELSNREIILVKAGLDRSESPGMGVSLSVDIEKLSGKAVVVVDDVLYSGVTMLNVVSILLQAGTKTIQVAVMIDRGHRLVPVSADFIGMELATTLQQHVSFETTGEKKEVSVYLL